MAEWLKVLDLSHSYAIFIRFSNAFSGNITMQNHAKDYNKNTAPR